MSLEGEIGDKNHCYLWMGFRSSFAEAKLEAARPARKASGH